MSIIKRDWDDLLGPMLIKELRQGLREPSFVISFIALQAGLAFLNFIGLGSDGDSDSLEEGYAWFQGALVATFLLVLPLRGLFALSQERRQNTMETMLLTRLSAHGVVFGKWTALVFQGFLLATTVLPYIIIRYLTVGEELVTTLTFDLFLFWGFLLMSSFCVGLSAVSMIFSRIVGFLALLIFGSGVLGSVIWSSSSSRAGGLDLSIHTLSWGVLLLIFIPLVVFDLAAASVGTMVENGVVRRRLMILLFLSLLCALQYFSAWDTLFIQGLCIVIGACVIEVGQIAELKERNMESFVRYGFIGKILALGFLPGWQSGIVYTLVTLPLCLLAALNLRATSTDIMIQDTLAWTVAIMGSIMIPLVIILVFMSWLRIRCFLIALINVISFAVCGLLQAIFSTTTPFRPLDILTFFPTVATLVTDGMLNNSPNATDENDFIFKGGVVDLFFLGLLMVFAIPWLKSFQQAWVAARINPLNVKGRITGVVNQAA